MYSVHAWNCLLSMAFIPVFATAPFALAQTAPQDGAGAYATGKYRNLFVEAGHSPQEVKAKIDTAFQQLFHGDPQTQAVTFSAGSNANGPLMYLKDVYSRDVRTEGMSYGMMIAVQLDKKAEFDALWNWAMTYMYISDPKHPSYGFFSWSCKTDGSPNDESPAPTAKSTSRWRCCSRQSLAGRTRHLRLSCRSLATALRDASPRGHHRRHEVRAAQCGSGGERGERDDSLHPAIMPHPFTDPSYHLPAFYELWARWGPVEDCAFWARAAEVSRAFFVKTRIPRPALLPTTPTSTARRTSPAIRSRASSPMMRGAQPATGQWMVVVAQGARGAGVERPHPEILRRRGDRQLWPVYTLDGKSLGTPGQNKDHPVGLVGVNAAAGLAATDQARAKQFTEALWKTPIPSGQGRYYDGMLYLMSFMHMSGEFRIWPPK